MREIETRTSTMTDEREDITPERWVDIRVRQVLG